MRGPPVGLRELTAEEASAVDSLARSRTAAARRVERARMVWRAHQGETPPTLAERLGLSAETVRRRMRRFNTEGLAALEDHHRSGRPATDSPEQVATVVALALTAPQSLGLPFASWTLDRRAAYLSEHKAIAIRRSRIDEILLAEGLRWRRHETWFGERVDPEFAEKGAHREALPRPAGEQHSSLPGRDGARQRQELSGPGLGSIAPPTHGPGSTRDRLRLTRQRLHLRRLLPCNGCCRHAALPGPGHRPLGGLPERGRTLDPGRDRAGLCHRRYLSSHRTTDVLLFMLAHPRWEMVFQPKYAAYLNLIEPWWKILRSLALAGQRFERWEDIAHAVVQATVYWNAHRHPFRWRHRRRHRPRRQPGIARPPIPA